MVEITKCAACIQKLKIRKTYIRASQKYNSFITYFRQQMIGNPFLILESVDSTNNYAIGQVHAGLARHGAAYFARDQYAGKGQRNKSWNSAPGENLVLSIVLEPLLLKPATPFILSAVIALAAYQLWSAHAGSESSIKWPNDLYWRDRKAGGMLIENIYRGSDWKYAIAGIGINLNQVEFPATLQNPVSLRQVTGRNYDCEEFAKELCGFVETELQQLRDGGNEAVLLRYNEVLYKRGESVRLKKLSAVFNTVIKSVNLNGQLTTTDTMERVFNFGEVEWILNS